MSIKDYNFCEFTIKDMFEAKLKGIIPDFGYISAAKRMAFLNHCTKLGFLDLLKDNDNELYYKVKHQFCYQTMGGYRPIAVISEVGDYMIFDQRSKPNKHIKQNWSEDKRDNWLAGLKNAKF